MKNRPLNTKRLARMYKQYRAEYDETALIAFSYEHVHVRAVAMSEVAPLNEWTLNEQVGLPGLCYFRHTILLHGVKFLAITDNPMGELPKEESQAPAPGEIEPALRRVEPDTLWPGGITIEDAAAAMPDDVIDLPYLDDEDADEVEDCNRVIVDPAEGWLADSYQGQYDDDPSPYDGNYSEE